MSGRHTRVVALAGAVSLALAACTGSDGDGDGEATPSPTVGAPERGAVQQPAEPTTVLTGADGSLALEASRTFFAEAPVVVLADDADPTTHLRASSAALALGAPVLLDDDGAALAEELARLGAGWVLTVGDAALPDGTAGPTADAEDVVVVPAPQDDDALAEMLDRPADAAVEVGEGREVATVVGLERGAFTPLVTAPSDEAATDGTTAPSDDAATDGATAGAEDAETAGGATADPEPTETGTDGGAADGPDARTADDETAELPETELPDPVTGTLALATGAPQELLATATAGAAGAELLIVPGGDPRATSETVAAVSGAGAEHVVGLGDGFGDAETLGWRAATAATGVELPGGGQLVFPGKRYVALYGSPVTSTMGVLGEQGTDATIARAAEHAQPYVDLTDDTVVPALEVIVTVASSSAGSDGNYSNEWPAEDFRELVEAAGEAGQYVVLDLQPGRSSFLEQAQLYAELLELPHVGLALDPEWNLGPDERHMVRIGSVTAAEVNEVVHWLADFTRERNLPQKLLVLHQFQVRMIQTVPEVDLSRSELAVLVHADGQGGQGAKQDTWRTLLSHGPDVQWWGWKNFYDEDQPMLTPEQTAQVEPFPHFISYQ
ncbi:hypothetical protein [Georgenia sp. H159]|uniref:hypothetical protein n=1 Tax=Georgenia sp. H159 TaxID=3076115 RepID=UPI002D76B195|nr:hypothetical protein [Georgenia sp. H159]